MADVAPKSTFENINDLIKALSWPMLVALVFLAYRSELNRIITLIPAEIENSSKISIGSLSLEVEKTAKATGNAELGKIIKNLSEREIRRLLTLGENSYGIVSRGANIEGKYTYTLPTDIDILLSLEKRGLLITEKGGSLSQFVKFFKSLHPVERTLYRYEDGNYTTNKSDNSTFAFTEYSILASTLSTSDSQRIEAFTVKLSPSGKKAFDIIVHATADQIKG